MIFYLGFEKWKRILNLGFKMDPLLRNQGSGLFPDRGTKQATVEDRRGQREAE
jgi:hypothetical protein